MVNLKELDAACRNRTEEWALHDTVLYDMCRNYPGHSSRERVNAKVGIIARAYATGIERKIRSDGGQGSALLQLTTFINRKHKAVDRAIGPLLEIEELTIDSLRKIVRAHGTLVALLAELTRDGQASRSFCSKYLHFHCPIVPVYDQVVASAIPSLMGWRPKLDVLIPPVSPSDRAYAVYAMRFLALYNDIRRSRPAMSVKELDFYLLNERARRKVR